MDIPILRNPTAQKSTTPLAWDDLRTVLAVAPVADSTEGMDIQGMVALLC